MKNDDIEKRINKILNEEETFLLSLLLLAQMHDDEKYKNISDLMFLFDNYKGFKNFIKYYGGTTINVPSVVEIKQVLRLLNLFQFVEIDKRDFDKSYDKLKLINVGLDRDYCKKQLDKFTDYLLKNGNVTLKQIKRLGKNK